MDSRPESNDEGARGGPEMEYGHSPSHLEARTPSEAVAGVASASPAVTVVVDVGAAPAMVMELASGLRQDPAPFRTRSGSSSSSSWPGPMG